MPRTKDEAEGEEGEINFYGRRASRVAEQKI
jgi:hypothetical protein